MSRSVATAPVKKVIVRSRSPVMVSAVTNPRASRSCRASKARSASQHCAAGAEMTASRTMDVMTGASSGDLAVIGDHGERVADGEDAEAPGEGGPDAGAD